MGGLNLLAEARSAGLDVQADGDRLVIRGPRAADAVARRLMAEKPAVLAALAYLALPGPADRAQVWINPESFEPGDDIPDRKPDGWRWVVATWPHDKWAEWRAWSSETTPEHARPEDIAAADYAAYTAVADRHDPDDLPAAASTALDPEERQEAERGLWRRARWAYLKAAVEYREARAALRLAREYLRRVKADALAGRDEIRRQRFRLKRAKIVRAAKFYAWDWAKDAYRRARERAALAGVLDASKAQVS